MSSTIRSVLPLLLSTFALLMAQGVAGMLLPLRAGEAGWTASAIGWMGATYAVGFILACVFAPRLVMRAGHIRLYAVLATGLAAAMLLHGLVVHPLAWALFRGLAGFCLAGTYMIVESWLNERSENSNRGAIFSLYMITNMVGLVAGQYTMPLSPQGGTALFMIAALIFLAAVVPTAMTTAQSPQPLTGASFDLKALYRNSPAALVGSFLAGVIAGLWNFLGPVYGAAIGFSTISIATMLASVMLGGAVFQYPLGRLSDKIDRRYVMAGAGGVGVVLSFVVMGLPASQPWTVFVAMFLLGSVMFPIYSLNVAHANDYAEPEDFVKIASGLLIANGLGAMVGPVLGGQAMDFVGPDGLFAVVATVFAAYGLYAYWRTLRREAIDPDERTDFRPLAINKNTTPQTYAMDMRSDPDAMAEEAEEDDERKTVWGYDFS